MYCFIKFSMKVAIFFFLLKKKKGKKILKESNNTKNTILQGRTMFIVENTHLTLCRNVTLTYDFQLKIVT